MSRIFISGRGELPTEIETPRILPNLDLVRAAAISGVIAFHYLGAQFRFPSSGWTGVWLFFVLSGFLITRGLLAQTHRPLRDYLGRFYKRRALRIFPLYFSYLFTIGVISFAFAVPLAPPDSAPLAWLVLFMDNVRNWYWAAGNPYIDHMWSLSTEEQFYLVFPLLIYAIPARLRNVFLVTALVAVAMARGIAGHLLVIAGYSARDVAETAIVFPFLQWDAFLAGALLAVNEERISAAPMRRVIGAATLVVVSSIAAIALLRSTFVSGIGSIYEGLLLVDIGDEALQDVWVFLLIILVCVALTALAARAGTGRRILPLRFADHIGKVSFGMYVLHMPLCGWLLHVTAKRDRASFVLSFLALYVATVLAASLTYAYWERPFLRMKDRRITFAPPWLPWPAPDASNAINPGGAGSRT